MIQAGTISTGSAADRGGRRRILDQLDQLVAEHDLAGRGGEVLADLEAVGLAAPPWRRCRSRQQVIAPASEVGPAAGAGGLRSPRG